MNPTNSGYDFIWRKEDSNLEIDTGANYFNCMTLKGRILSGKKFD